MSWLSQHRWLPWLLVAIAAALPYGSALRGGFTFDDEGLILKNPAVDPAAPWWRAWTSSYWPAAQQSGLYRPVSGWTFWVQRRLTGDDAFPFRAANVLLHVGVCLLVLAMLRRVLPASPLPALAAALLFAAHPIHSEAVAGIVGRAELLAALFGLAGYLLWLNPGRGRAFLVGLAFALAAAAKESAIGWIALVALHRLGLFGDGRGYHAITRSGAASRQSLRAAIGVDIALLAGFVLYFVARSVILGGVVALSGVTPIENPLIAVPAAVRVLNAFKVLAIGIGRVIWPAKLVADYSFQTIALDHGLFSGAGLALAFFILLAAAALALRRRAPDFTWAIALYGAIIFPVSNILLPIGTIFGERLLYLPALGILAAILAAILACAARALPRLRLRAIAPWLLAAILIVLGARTWQRNNVWRDNLSLFTATAKATPNNVKAQVNLAASLVQADRPTQAEPYYLHALALRPDYLPALNGLGHLKILAHRYAEAESLLQRAADLEPANNEAFMRLGNMYLELGRGQDALAAFDRVLAVNAESLDGWIGRASALFMLGRYPQSAEAWQHATKLSGRGLDLRRHLAAALEKSGRLREANTLLTELLAERPRDPDLLASLASVRLAEGDSGDGVLGLARAALAVGPTPRRMEVLARILAARGRCDQAWAMLSSTDVSSFEPAERDSLERAIARACPGQ